MVVEEDVVNGGFDFCFRGGCLSCGFYLFYLNPLVVPFISHTEGTLRYTEIQPSCPGATWTGVRQVMKLVGDRTQCLGFVFSLRPKGVVGDG